MVSSSLRAHNEIARNRPDIAEILDQPFYFSRQAEEAPDEAAFYPNPVFDMQDGVFCSKWNRNRINSAQKIAGVPQLTPRQREAMDVMDDTLRRPDLMYEMFLQPGDMQILSNHTMLHSRNLQMKPAQRMIDAMACSIKPTSQPGKQPNNTTPSARTTSVTCLTHGTGMHCPPSGASAM